MQILLLVDRLDAFFNHVGGVLVGTEYDGKVPFDADVLWQAPVEILLRRAELRQRTVFENQAPAAVYAEKAAVGAGHVEVGCLAGPICIRVRLYHCALVNQQFLHRVDVRPVDRLLQSSAVIQQHDDNGTAKQPCPSDSGGRLVFPIQAIEGVVQKFLQLGIAHIILHPMLERLLCWPVDDLAEKAVVLVLFGEVVVRNHKTARGVDVLRPILPKHVRKTVCPEHLTPPVLYSITKLKKPLQREGRRIVVGVSL